MITEEDMSHEDMEKRVETHWCGECGAGLNVAWGGAFGLDSWILRCSANVDHKTITDYKKPTAQEEQVESEIRRIRGMDTKALMKMNQTEMLARIAQAKFPKDLTAPERQLMAQVSISYGLDPLMNELMIYQGNPYPTINARYRKAQETDKFDGIDTRPATKEERTQRNAKEGDYLYRCEVWVKGASHPFVGWGRVRAAETKGSEHLPIVKDPDRQAEKRAEAMGLRKGFSMPVPFKSWEEFEEEKAEQAIKDEVIDVDPLTGEVIEPKGEKPKAQRKAPPKKAAPPKTQPKQPAAPEPEAKAEESQEAPTLEEKEAEAEAKEEPPPDDSKPPQTAADLFERLAQVKGWKGTQYCQTWITNTFPEITPERIENDPAGVWEQIQPLL